MRSVASPVMVIDDDNTIREVLAGAVGAAGYQVICACNGAEALALLADCQPSLILLDVEMPVMDGRSFARTYRDTAEIPAPIVLVSGSADIVSTARDVGAVAYLAKPFGLAQLVGILQEHSQWQIPA